MTPEIEGGIFLGILSMFAVWFLYRSILLISAKIRFSKNYNNGPRGLLYKDEDLCKPMHDWSPGIHLAIRELPYTQYTICTNCGYIQGTEYKLNDPGVDALIESLKLRSEKLNKKRMIYARVEFDIEACRDKWIESNLSNLFEICEKGNEEALISNLEYFFKYALESEKEVIEKIQAEMDYQTDIQETYQKLGIWQDEE